MAALRTSPYIGLTIGDPSGIGPELVAAAITDAPADLRRRLWIFCDRPILERALAQVFGARVPSDLTIVDRQTLSPDQAPLGAPTAAGAAAQVGYLEGAAKAALAKEIGAVVTAPISKVQAKQAGFEFAGQTEFFAHRLGATETAMMFASPKLHVVLATIHIPLAEVAGSLSAQRITTVTRLAAEALARDFGVSRPRIGVLGLNPHAGDAGLFGREEIEIIEPAIEESRRQLGDRADIYGPLPADSAFRGEYDLFVAMYHDQGLMPVKLLDFERAVNVTLGLPIIRTSPDHGVAYQLAGTGQARPQSFFAALRLAGEILERRPQP